MTVINWIEETVCSILIYLIKNVREINSNLQVKTNNYYQALFEA